MSEDKPKRPQDITSAEKLTRVHAVLDLLLGGFGRHQIIEFCRIEYKVTHHSTDIYIADAKAIMVEKFKETVDIDAFKADIYTRLEHLYKMNIDIDDYKAAQGCLKDIREMLGLNASQKLDLSTMGKELNTQPTIISVSVVPPIEDDDE